jgi:hypothetical protein
MLLAFAWSGADCAKIANHDSFAQGDAGFQQSDQPFHSPCMQSTLGVRVRNMLKPALTGNETESIPAAFCQRLTEAIYALRDFSPSLTLQSQFVRLQV